MHLTTLICSTAIENFVPSRLKDWLNSCDSPDTVHVQEQEEGCNVVTVIPESSKKGRKMKSKNPSVTVPALVSSEASPCPKSSRRGGKKSTSTVDARQKALQSFTNETSPNLVPTQHLICSPTLSNGVPTDQQQATGNGFPAKKCL